MSKDKTYVSLNLPVNANKQINVNMGPATEEKIKQIISIHRKPKVSKVAKVPKSHSLMVKVSPLEVLPFKIFLGV